MNAKLLAVTDVIDSESYLLGFLFMVLMVAPLWSIGTQIKAILDIRKSIGNRHQRFESYVFLERVRNEMQVAMPIGQELVLSGKVMSSDEARRIWNSVDTDGADWDSKVMLTHMLEVLDRLASGARMGVVDIHVWQAMSGSDLTTIYESLQNFIKVSQEHRPGRYVALGWVHQQFSQIARTEKIANLDETSEQIVLSAS